MPQYSRDVPKESSLSAIQMNLLFYEEAMIKEIFDTKYFIDEHKILH